MKKIFFAIFVFSLIGVFSFSLQSSVYAATQSSDTLTLKGDIIDNKCAGGHKNDLSEFVKSHPKQCALMPGCVASGFSLYADNVLYKFDSVSNNKVEEFLKQESNKLQVLVTAKKVGEELSLISIKNQD